jgi:hypothetical protein
MFHLADQAAPGKHAKAIEKKAADITQVQVPENRGYQE